MSPLHCVACKGEGYLDTLNALLQAPNINIDIVNSEGNHSLSLSLSLHCVACKDEGYLDTLNALLQAPNINIDIVNSEGNYLLATLVLLLKLIRIGISIQLFTLD